MDNNTLHGASQAGTSNTESSWIHTDSSRPPQTCGRVSRYLKGEGRNALLGHVGTAAGANAVYLLIILILNIVVNAAIPYTTAGLVISELLSVLLGILAGLLQYGLISIYMNLLYGQFTKFSDLFNGFRENSDKIILVECFLVLIETACSLPAVIVSYLIPGMTGIIATAVLTAVGFVIAFYCQLTYALSLYILLDYPDMPWKDVLRKSRTLMKGHRRHLLYIECSFLPFYLLSVLSFGIASILVTAYEQSTLAAFYKGRMENRLM